MEAFVTSYKGVPEHLLSLRSSTWRQHQNITY